MNIEVVSLRQNYNVLLSYFKKQQPATVFLFIVLFLLLKIPFLLKNNFYPIISVDNLLGGIGILFAGSFYLNFFLAQVFLFSQAIIFNQLFRLAGYHESAGVVPAIYYILLSSFHPAFNEFTIYTIIGFVLLWMFYMLLQITVKESAKVECFNLGIIGGILVLLDLHCLIFLPFVFLMLYALKPFRLEEYLLMLFGMLCPFYFAFGATYLLDGNIRPFTLKIFEWFHFHNDLYNKVLFSMLGVYLLCSFVVMQGINFSAGFKKRKNVNMLAFFLVGMSVVLLFSGTYGEPASFLLLIPVSIFLTLLMLRIRKNRLAEFFNLIFVLVVISINIIRAFR